MKRPWLYYISPLVLVAMVSLIPIGIALLDDIIILIFFVPAALLLLGFDYFIKWITNGKILYIWIIEAVIIAALYFLLLGSTFRLSGC